MRRTLLPGLAATILLAALGGCGIFDSGPPPNLLIITLDTTRADFIGCYGADGAHTPELDRLAAEGALFERNISASQCTNPSHSSIMTGMHPSAHTVLDNATPLPEAARTLAERCRDAGYRTLGAVSARHLNPINSNFAQGFDQFFECNRIEIPATVRNQTFLPALRELASGEQPFMAWVHYFDPHSLYSPPAPFDTLHAIVDEHPSMAPRRSMEIGEAKKNAEIDPDEFIALYKGEISFVDQELGRALAILDQLEISENTIVVVVGDHGESLADNDIYFCHAGMFESVMHVPLLIRWPKKVRAGTRVRALTSSIDIVPTLVEMMRLPKDDSLVGQSLVRSLRNPDRQVHEMVVAEAVSGVIRTIYAEGYKFLKPYPSDWALKSARLHDLSTDPTEARDLSVDLPDLRNRLEARLDGWVDAMSGLRLDAVEGHEMDKATEEALRALGYIQ